MIFKKLFKFCDHNWYCISSKEQYNPYWENKIIATFKCKNCGKFKERKFRNTSLTTLDFNKT